MPQTWRRPQQREAAPIILLAGRVGGKEGGWADEKHDEIARDRNADWGFNIVRPVMIMDQQPRA